MKKLPSLLAGIALLSLVAPQTASALNRIFVSGTCQNKIHLILRHSHGTDNHDPVTGWKTTGPYIIPAYGLARNDNIIPLFERNNPGVPLFHDSRLPLYFYAVETDYKGTIQAVYEDRKMARPFNGKNYGFVKNDDGYNANGDTYINFICH